MHCSTRAAFSPVKLIRKCVTRVSCAVEELGVKVKASQCQYPVVLPQSLCVWCAACWEGGFRHLELLLSHQGTAPGSAWALPSCCLPPIRATSPGAGWRLLLVVPVQLSWALRCRRDPGLAHSHEAPLITCLQVTSHRFCGDLARVGGLCGLAEISRMGPGKADLGEGKLWVGKWYIEIITCPRLLP